jgi:hypothetical protein
MTRSPNGAIPRPLASVVNESGRGYCRQCAAFLRGEISEADAPSPRQLLASCR